MRIFLELDVPDELGHQHPSTVVARLLGDAASHDAVWTEARIEWFKARFGDAVFVRETEHR